MGGDDTKTGGGSGYTPASYGVSVKGASPPGAVHTAYTILGLPMNATHGGQVPPKELFANNPEWFWPRNGAYGQLCWANSSLLKFVAAQAIKYLRAQPQANLLSVSQNDNAHYCNDSFEQKIIAAEGSAMGPLLRAVNFVADAVKNEFPQRSIVITTLAYDYGRKAPSITKPRENVAIQV
jgi:hypothetical protein